MREITDQRSRFKFIIEVTAVYDRWEVLLFGKHRVRNLRITAGSHG